MKKMLVPCLSFASLILSSSLALSIEPDTAAQKYWPQWRGPNADGVASQSNPPVEWSDSKNVRWKMELPGRGASSPVVWEDSVFVTSAVPVDQTQGAEEPEGQRGRGMSGIQPSGKLAFVVLAVGRQDGKILWQRTVREEVPHEGTHGTGTWASNSVVTDGVHLYAYFGSRGLYCLDMKGNVLWERDLGDMNKKRAFGEGSSPVLADDKVLVLWDHEGPSFLFAISKATGEIAWKVERDEDSSWSTPLVTEYKGVKQVITNATKKIRSYDLKDGRLIWEVGGMTENVIPSPVRIDDMILLTSGFRGNALLAVRLDNSGGDLTGSNAVAWKLDSGTPYVPSPLLYDGNVYVLKTNSGILSCINARTGEIVYEQQRLPGIGTVYASPVGAAGRLYIADRDGNTLVVRSGSKFEVLATNTLNDGLDASFAVVENQILIRGQKHMYCIEQVK